MADERSRSRRRREQLEAMLASGQARVERARSRSMVVDTIRDQARDADLPVRVVLLDLSFTPELDIESVDVLASIRHELGARGVALWLAGVRAGLLEMLVRSGWPTPSAAPTCTGASRTRPVTSQPDGRSGGWPRPLTLAGGPRARPGAAGPRSAPGRGPGSGPRARTGPPGPGPGRGSPSPPVPPT